MKNEMNRKVLVVGLVLVFACGGVAYSGGRDHDDHDQAHDAVEKGLIRPLAEILASVEDELGGEVVGVEFEHEDGRYIYEFEIVSPSGRLREVYVDAMTAEILQNEDN